MKATAYSKQPQLRGQITASRFLIMGNPNSGKTALFNRLTGRHHKVGNFPGVTVEQRIGYLRNRNIRIDDLPGTYSLKPQSFDEEVVTNIVHSWRQKNRRPNGIIIIVDATNFSRTIFLALQILDYGIPAILVLNMIDEARHQGIRIQVEKLKIHLAVEAIVTTSAKTGEGIDNLINEIEKLSIKNTHRNPNRPILLNIEENLAPIQELVDMIGRRKNEDSPNPIIEAIRLIENDTYFKTMANYFTDVETAEMQKCIKKTRERLHLHGIVHTTLESDLRYGYIDRELSPLLIQNGGAHTDLSERIDRLLTHPIWGIVIMIAVLGLIFNAIFSWAEYPMNLIEGGLVSLVHYTEPLITDVVLKSLIFDGIIAGVGNVIIFLPQILLLIFFLGILEDTGYMSRMSFMMDRIMKKFGLHGKSVLPMLSGFACAIPATMATRTVENWQDRLKLIMLIPLMSCSARLPIYTLLISAFVPDKTYFGIVSLQGMTLLSVYILGFLTALLIAFDPKVLA